MKILKFYGNTVDERNAAEIADALTAGQVVIYPTDTHYALGCSALSRKGIETLSRLKGVDAARGLLALVCADISQAAEFARIDNAAFRVIKRNTPGAVTFILPPAVHLAKTLKGRKSIGVRIPGQGVARAIARLTGAPILSASLPLESELAADPDAVSVAYAGTIDLMADAGEVPGESSTIVDLTETAAPEITRQGAAEVEL